MATNNPSTKSIDVGSMFLMDLSVNESDLGDAHSSIDNAELPFPANSIEQNSVRGLQMMYGIQSSYSAEHQSTGVSNYQNVCKYLDSSLDRLANVINGDRCKATGAIDTYNGDDVDERRSSLVTLVEPQPLPDIGVPDSAKSSLTSTESFVASSGSLGSSSNEAYTGSEAEFDERASTTTREDSGVLDMRDLDSQFNNSFENEEICCNHNQQQTPLRQQEKPISTDITATNLINRSAIKNYNSPNPNLPTNNRNHHNQNLHNNDHRHHNTNKINHRCQSKRSISASLPIQVPAREMKKNLNKLKLNLINKDMEAQNEATAEAQLDEHLNNTYGFHDSDNSRRPTVVTNDDFDEFLEQEFNENHQNHYPIDEYDGENLRAEENPMKLFQSIQALARSLHEDAELFGSLPPKRMLESPIRSIALV